MTGPGDFDAAEDPITTQIRAFLAGRNIPRHKQVLALAEACKVSRTTIHRKFKGEGPWVAADLQVIADAYGVTVEQLTSQDSEGVSVHAIVRIPKCPTTGKLVVGNLLDKTEICDLVAVEGPEGWEVYPRSLAPKASDKFSVKKLTLSALPHVRVALLEDSASAAEAVADGLKDFGFAVTTFGSSQALLNVMAEGRFKAYVLDWDLGGTTSEVVLAAIREFEAQQGVPLNKRAPIIVTTGVLQGADQRTAGQRLYPATERFNAQIQTKPTPPSLLAAVIQRALAP